jgi:hypothetical protein
MYERAKERLQIKSKHFTGTRKVPSRELQLHRATLLLCIITAMERLQIKAGGILDEKIL